MKITKQYVNATAIWLVLFLVDYIVELFKIKDTSIVVTLMGLKINSTFTKTEIYTEFSPTLRILWVYLLIVSIWLVGYILFKKVKVHGN